MTTQNNQNIIRFPQKIKFKEYSETGQPNLPTDALLDGSLQNDNDITDQRPQQQPQQQPQARAVVDEVKGKWKQQVGAAKVAWGELTEDELLKSEGQIQKLAGLVQERYAITRGEAEKQVKSFFDTHRI